MLLNALLASLAVAAPPGPPVEPSAQAYAESLQRFGAKLFLAADEKPGANLFVSPASAHIAFGMLGNGLQGRCLQETEKMLGIRIPELNRQAEAFYRRTRADGGKTLSIANGVWSVRPSSLRPAYLKAVRQAFDAETGQLDWQSGPRVVNAWVKERTRGRISALLERLRPNDAFVIVNALAFDSDWASPFKKESTFEATFANGANNPKVKMMSQTLACPAGEWEGRRAVALPYKSGYDMLAILPAKSEKPRDVVAALAKGGWAELARSLRRREASVTIPKFRAESKVDIKKILPALGAPSLVQFSYDFEPMVGRVEAAVSQAVQKVFVEVDEQGTRAAAATAIVGALKSAMPVEPFEFRADRPFVVALVERATGVPVILGSVRDPSK